MRTSNKKKISVAERREIVADLYITKKKTQREVAEVCGCDQRTICNDVKAILEEMKERTLSIVETAIVELEHATRQLWEQWERSKEDFRIRLSEITDPGKEGEQRKRSIKREQRLAEVAFMKEIRENIKLRCELSGHKPPAKFASTTPDGSKPHDPGISGRSFTALLAQAEEIIAETESSEKEGTQSTNQTDEERG